jgi:hypothetical protein
MTTNERQELDQIRRDLAVLARRLMAHSGGKPDLRSVLERNSNSVEAVNYTVVPGGERVSA